MRPAWRAGRWSSAYATFSRAAAAVLDAFASPPPDAALDRLEKYVRTAGVLAAPIGEGGSVLDSAGPREAVASQIYLLAGVGRLIPAATLLAVVLELGWGLSGGSGLMGLQAGLPQRAAFGGALMSLAIGGVSAGVHTWLVRRAHVRLHTLERACRVLDEKLVPVS